MANVAMELLESSLETRLENTFHIKAKLSECADKQRIEIVASLLYAYDQVRQLHCMKFIPTSKYIAIHSTFNFRAGGPILWPW